MAKICDCDHDKTLENLFPRAQAEQPGLRHEWLCTNGVCCAQRDPTGGSLDLEDVHMRWEPPFAEGLSHDPTGTWNSSVMCELKPLPHWTVLAMQPLETTEGDIECMMEGRQHTESSESMVMIGISSADEDASNSMIDSDRESSAEGQRQVVRVHGGTNDDYEQDSNISRSFSVEFASERSGSAVAKSKSNNSVTRQKSLRTSSGRANLYAEDDGANHHCDEETFRNSVEHLTSGPDTDAYQKALQFQLASEEVLRATMAHSPLDWFGWMIRNHVQGFARQVSSDSTLERKDSTISEWDDEPESPDSPRVPDFGQGLSHSVSRGSDSPSEASPPRFNSTRSDSSAKSSILSQIFPSLQYAFDPYSKSFQTPQIDDFWSHSWRAPAISKVLTLILYYNGLPGAIIGSTLAGLMCGLVGEGILPGPSEVHPVWTLDCASLAFFLTLLSWQARRRVFLDKVCIHQTDLDLKKKGVESIGGFLKHSNAVLMLWDPTYGKRLWCVFEVAAFTKIHEDEGSLAAPIIVRPVNQGPLILMSMVVLIACLNAYHLLALWVDENAGIHSRWASAIPSFMLLFLSVTLLVAMFESYNRNMKKFFRQLRHFKLKSSQCYCCTVNHVDPNTGKELLCDRAIVYTCVEQWFGTYERFETFVRMPLYERFEKQLGRMYLPYRAIVVGSLPLAWTLLGTAAADLRERWRLLKAVTCIVRAMTCWLAMGPLVVAIWILLISRVSKAQLLLKFSVCGNKFRPRTRKIIFAAQVACLCVIPPVTCYAAVVAVDEFIPDWGDFLLLVIFGCPTVMVYRGTNSFGL